MQRLLLFPLLLSATASAAPPPSGLTPLPNPLPNRCAALAVTPASARITDPVFAAHVSVANCLAEVAMNNLTLHADVSSAANLDLAVAPSLAILDDVIHVGDPAWKLVAEDAKRDTYASMIVRERAAATDAIERISVEPLLVPWQHLVDKSEVAMRELVRANPAMARTDSVIANIITDHDLVAHAR